MRTRAIYQVTTESTNRALWMWVLLPAKGTGFDDVRYTLPGGGPCDPPDELVGGWVELTQWPVRDSDLGGEP